MVKLIRITDKQESYFQAIFCSLMESPEYINENTSQIVTDILKGKMKVEITDQSFIKEYNMSMARTVKRNVQEEQKT